MPKPPPACPDLARALYEARLPPKGGYHAGIDIDKGSGKVYPLIAGPVARAVLAIDETTIEDVSRVFATLTAAGTWDAVRKEREHDMAKDYSEAKLDTMPLVELCYDGITLSIDSEWIFICDTCEGNGENNVFCRHAIDAIAKNADGPHLQERLRKSGGKEVMIEVPLFFSSDFFGWYARPALITQVTTKAGPINRVMIAIPNEPPGGSYDGLDGIVPKGMHTYANIGILPPGQGVGVVRDMIRNWVANMIAMFGDEYECNSYYHREEDLPRVEVEAMTMGQMRTIMTLEGACLRCFIGGSRMESDVPGGF